MKKKVVLVLTQILICQAFSEAPNNSNVGMAAKEGKSNASAIAWSLAGVSLLITIGVITAIVIQNEK